MKKYITKDEILKLFNTLGVTYLTDYSYEYEIPEECDLTDTDYFQDNFDEFTELTSRYGDDILHNRIADTYVMESEGRGLGLYAKSLIPEGTFIGIYLGVVREQDEFVTIDDTGIGTDYAWDYPDEIEGHSILEIDAKPAGNDIRFVNHGKVTNLNVEHTLVNNRWYIFFVAARDIIPDEELFVSYGEAYWDSEYREEL